MSFLQKLGIGIKEVFHWLTSAKGTAVVTAVEGTVEEVAPQLTGMINIVNNWMTKAFTVEGIAEAAGAAAGTGVQKAAILLNDLGPVVLADAKTAGLPAPTEAVLAEVNAGVVNIINLLTGTKPPTTTTPAA